jgi:hypothetical protein
LPKRANNTHIAMAANNRPILSRRTDTSHIAAATHERYVSPMGPSQAAWLLATVVLRGVDGARRGSTFL